MNLLKLFEASTVAHLNATCNNCRYVVECGDEVITKTDSILHAVNFANSYAGSMAAHIYKRDNEKGFYLYATFHGDPQPEMTEEQIAMMKTTLKG